MEGHIFLDPNLPELAPSARASVFSHVSQVSCAAFAHYWVDPCSLDRFCLPPVPSPSLPFPRPSPACPLPAAAARPPLLARPLLLTCADLPQLAPQTLAQLHSLDPSALGLSDFGSPRDYCARQLKRWAAQYRDSGAAPCWLVGLLTCLGWSVLVRFVRV